MWWVGVGIGGYAVAAALALAVNLASGPVTPGLALLRAALWPLWLAGMIPGQRMPMD